MYLYLLIIIYCIYTISRNIYIKKLIETKLYEYNYFQERDIFMTKIFKNTKWKYKINVSAKIVNNFNSYKEFDYLIKYFNMNFDKESIPYFKNFLELVNNIENEIPNKKAYIKRLNSYFPTFTLTYTSPKGRSHLEHSVYFNSVKISEILNKIETLYDKKSFITTQRKMMTANLRQQILERDHYTCQKCGNNRMKEPNLLLEIDHIIPVSKGGLTEPNNLQTLCWKCNRSKSNNIN